MAEKNALCKVKRIQQLIKYRFIAYRMTPIIFTPQLNRQCVRFVMCAYAVCSAQSERCKVSP